MNQLILQENNNSLTSDDEKDEFQQTMIKQESAQYKLNFNK